MNLRPLGNARASRSPRSATAPGASARRMWIGADDDESLRALERAIDLGAELHRHRAGLRRRPLRAARRPGGPRPRRDGPRRDEDPAEEHALAGAPPTTMSTTRSPATTSARARRRSLRNLGLETLDLQQFHVWHDDWLEQGDWLETVEALKQEGKIRAFGVSINDHEPDTALELVAVGPRRHRAGDLQRLRPDARRTSSSRPCAEHGVGVLARVPFDEGGLTGRDRRPTPSSRRATSARATSAATASSRSAERVQAIVDDLGHRAATSSPRPRCATSSPSDAVSTVIPGMRSVRNVERNCAAGDGRGLPARAGREAQRAPLGAQLLPLTRAAILGGHAPSPAARRPARARRRARRPPRCRREPWLGAARAQHRAPGRGGRVPVEHAVRVQAARSRPARTCSSSTSA